MCYTTKCHTFLFLAIMLVLDSHVIVIPVCAVNPSRRKSILRRDYCQLQCCSAAAGRGGCAEIWTKNSRCNSQIANLMEVQSDWSWAHCILILIHFVHPTMVSSIHNPSFLLYEGNAGNMESIWSLVISNLQTNKLSLWNPVFFRQNSFDCWKICKMFV